MPPSVKRIWSLYEMLEETARAYYQLGTLISQITGKLHLEGDSLDGDDLETLETIKSIAERCRQFVSELKMPTTSAYLEDALEMLNSKTLTQNGIQQVEYLPNVIKAELKSRTLFRIEVEKTTFHEQDQLFGPDVENQFSTEVLQDIKEAGTCYALGMSTACVLHLMRVLEQGLKRLATDPALSLKLSLRPPDPMTTMGTIAKSFRTAADNWPISTDQEKEEKASLKAIADAFVIITHEWRDKTVHTTKEYSDKSAGLILKAVESMMQHAAQLLISPGPPN